MAQELTGLEYLKKKEIKNMKCKMDRPFALISYSHDDYDSQIVMNVFRKLMQRGHNLWIDTANMPVDENSWKKAARTALRNKNCKLAFFFRSENSMVKPTIAEELKTIKVLKHIERIATVNIWHKEGIDAQKKLSEVYNNGSDEELEACEQICELVSTECKAIRLAGDASNNISSLVEEMEEELRTIEDASSDRIGDESDANGNEATGTQEHTNINPEPPVGNGSNAGPTEEAQDPKPVVPISEKTTLKEFQGCFENLDFVYSLREVRNKCKKQLFDYLMASLLRGCDKNPGTDKAVIDRDRYNYCTYVISQTLNQEQPQIGASYYTWTSNARKALKREAMPSNYFAEDGRVKSGLLGDDINKIFEALDGNMTIGEVLQKYKSEEKGFVTKDNKSVLDAWELIKGMSSGNKGGKQGLGELLI